MVLRSLFLLISALFACVVQAQDLTIHVDKKGNVGFVDKNGKVVIKCTYESAYPFENGYAIVTKSQKSGIIDEKGKVVLPLKYNSIRPWTSDLYLITAGKKVGLASHSGKIVLPTKYSAISKPNCYGKALVTLGGKLKTENKNKMYVGGWYGVLDDKGTILIKPIYKGLYEFSFDGTDKALYGEGLRLEYSDHPLSDTLKTDCSYLGYSKNGISIFQSGILDGKGKVILKSGLYYLVMKPQGDMVRYYNSKKKQTICGYHNLTTGKGFVATTFDSNINDIKQWTHGDFTGDIAPVYADGWKFIDKTGKVLRQGYKDLHHSLYTGVWAAKTEAGTWDAFDEFNHDVAGLSSYQDILMPRLEKETEVYTVKKDGLYGVVNRKGETVVPFNYDDAYGNKYDFIAVKKNGKWGAVSPSGKEIIPIKYSSLRFPEEFDSKDFWVVKEDSLYYHYNTTRKSLGKTGYKDVLNFEDNVACVAPVGLKIENTTLNRALLYIPNVSQATIKEADVTKKQGSFAYLLNANDEIIFDLPVTYYYSKLVLEEMRKLGNRKLREYEKKNILLKVTQENRTYDLKTTIGEEEWNY